MIQFQCYKFAILCSAALCLFMVLGPSTLAEQFKISDLRSQGWNEIERREEIKKFPGERPYENLTRIIQLVHFIFEKGGVKKYCWISYDSQRDQVSDDCKPN